MKNMSGHRSLRPGLFIFLILFIFIYRFYLLLPFYLPADVNPDDRLMPDFLPDAPDMNLLQKELASAFICTSAFYACSRNSLGVTPSYFLKIRLK